MTTNANEIRVGASGRVSVAPAGTTLPVEPDEALDVAFVDLGSNTEDGVTLSPSRSFERIREWQSRKPVRTLISEDDLTASFALQQWNETTVPLAFGGGTISATPGGETKFVPPSAGTIDERVMVIDWTDGDISYRLILPRCQVTEVSDIVLKRTDSAALALTVEVLGSDPDDFILLTDDPSWDA